MASNPGTRALEAALKAQPATHKVAVYQGDEHQRDVAMKTGRNRVSLTLQVLVKLSWTRIELLDRKGQTLDVVDNEGPATDMEDISDKRGLREERIVQLVLTAQRTALEYQSEEMRSMAASMVSTMNVMATAFKQLADVYREQTEVAAALGAAEARIEAAQVAGAQQQERSEEDEMDGLVKHAIVAKLLGGDDGAGGGGPPGKH